MLSLHSPQLPQFGRYLNQFTADRVRLIRITGGLGLPLERSGAGRFFPWLPSMDQHRLPCAALSGPGAGFVGH